MIEAGDFVYLKRRDCCGTYQSDPGILRIDSIDGSGRNCDYWMEPNGEGRSWWHYKSCFSKLNKREL